MSGWPPGKHIWEVMLDSMGCSQMGDVLIFTEAFYVGSDMPEPERLGLPCCQCTLEQTNSMIEKQVMAYDLN